MILLNVYLDKSVTESLFLNKQYTGPDGSTRQQYLIDKRIYPGEPFDTPIFTFKDCKPDRKTGYMLKISIGPRLSVSRISTASGGLTKMQVNVEKDVKQVTPKNTLYLAKTGLPLPADRIQEFHDKYRWGYECRLLSQPDKIVAYLYVAPS